MSEPKFTKGEWSYKHTPTYGVCSESTHNHRIVADIDGSECRLASINVDDDEDIANAHLIASAPDMYKMINELIKQGTDLLSIDEITDEEDAATVHSNFNDQIINAEKLISKSRGE